MNTDIQLNETNIPGNEQIESAVPGLSAMFRSANSAPAVRDFGHTFLAASVARYIEQTGDLRWAPIFGPIS